MAIVTATRSHRSTRAIRNDYRPSSRWALLVDPGGRSEARVDDITLDRRRHRTRRPDPAPHAPDQRGDRDPRGQLRSVTLGEDTREVWSRRDRLHPRRYPARHAEHEHEPGPASPRCSPRSRSGSATSNATPRRAPKATRRSPPSRSTCVRSVDRERFQHGGGGNRTRVRGRTEQSVYERSSRFDLTRRPVRERPTDGPAILKCRASGDWLSLGASPIVGAELRISGRIRVDVALPS